jgi:hypothetical protein
MNLAPIAVLSLLLGSHTAAHVATPTVFEKHGDQFVRVSTIVPALESECERGVGTRAARSRARDNLVDGHGGGQIIGLSPIGHRM